MHSLARFALAACLLSVLAGNSWAQPNPNVTVEVGQSSITSVPDPNGDYYELVVTVSHNQDANGGHVYAGVYDENYETWVWMYRTGTSSPYGVAANAPGSFEFRYRIPMNSEWGFAITWGTFPLAAVTGELRHATTGTVIDYSNDWIEYYPPIGPEEEEAAFDPIPTIEVGGSIKVQNADWYVVEITVDYEDIELGGTMSVAVFNENSATWEAAQQPNGSTTATMLGTDGRRLWLYYVSKNSDWGQQITNGWGYASVMAFIQYPPNGDGLMDQADLTMEPW